MCVPGCEDAVRHALTRRGLFAGAAATAFAATAVAAPAAPAAATAKNCVVVASGNKNFSVLVSLVKQAGLVVERPQGRKVFYRATPEGLGPLIDWLSHYDAFWRERFSNLRTLLKEIDP